MRPTGCGAALDAARPGNRTYVYHAARPNVKEKGRGRGTGDDGQGGPEDGRRPSYCNLPTLRRYPITSSASASGVFVAASSTNSGFVGGS